MAVALPPEPPAASPPHLDPAQARILLGRVAPAHLPPSLRSLLAPRGLVAAVALGAWLGFAVATAGLSIVGSTSELLMTERGGLIMILAVVAGTLTGGLAGWNRAWRKGRRLDAALDATLPLHAFVLPGPDGGPLCHLAEPRARLDAASRVLAESGAALAEPWQRLQAAHAGGDGDDVGAPGEVAAAWSEARQLRRAHVQLDALIRTARESVAEAESHVPFHMDLTGVVAGVEDHVDRVEAFLARVPARAAG